MVKLTTTNIVGSADKKTWSQAQAITVKDNHQVMVVLRLSTEEEDSIVDLATMGAETLIEIEKKTEQSENIAQIKKLVDTVTNSANEGLKIEVLVATLHGDKLAIYGTGAVEAFLAREEKLAKLPTQTREGEGIVGTLQEGDVVTLSTARFVKVVGLDKFKQIVTEEEKPAELLAPLLHTQTDSSGMAALVGEVEVGEGEEEPKVGFFTTLMNKKSTIKLRSEVTKKTNLWVGAVILVLLVIMIGVGMVRRSKQVAEEEYLSVANSVNSKMEQVLSSGELNPEMARSLLGQARSEVEAYLATELKDEYKLKGQKLLQEIESADERAFKKNDIQLLTIVELPILVEGLKATAMKSDGGDNLIFVDNNEARLVSMNLIDRSRQILELEQDRVVDIGIGETRVYGLNSEGVTQRFWKKDIVTKIIESDEFWVGPTYIEMFAGNAYILDKGQNEIWKYPTLGETFGGRRRWFAAGITPDLSNVIDMKVSGDIWLLTSTGKLERYSRGAPVNFGMEGFPTKGDPKRFSEPAAIWVTDSLVFVLENGASRVVVFGEDGKYQAQYLNSEFAKATDLVIVDNKGYVLIDNSVKEFAL
jgi:hypothetical protein